MTAKDTSIGSANSYPPYGDKLSVKYLNEIGKLRAALILYLEAGVGNSTDFYKQGLAYDAATEVLGRKYPRQKAKGL